MRFLIDGYNLMHAAGRILRRFGPDGMRRARLRFLDELAILLGPDRAFRTTIVFDASSLPLNQAPESSHRGMTVIYAIEDDDADSRIELLIARDSAPKSLTVVSTDHRIRRAARRRRAEAVTSDDFLDFLDQLRERKVRPAPRVGREPSEEPERPESPSAAEVAAWVREFERVAREVEAEFRDVPRLVRPRSR
jgi:predicted RNA-binding protein with PIN domain